MTIETTDAPTTNKKLLDWVGSWFPSATPGQMPTVDPAVIKANLDLLAATGLPEATMRSTVARLACTLSR